MTAAATWTLPGYDVQSLLGFGTTGEVWRVREHVSGEVLAAKRLHSGAPPARLAAMRADLFRRPDHPHLVPLRAVVEAGDGGLVLVGELAAGGSLAALLSRRGRLEPGEVVTIAAPVGEALAAVHAAGLVHGGIGASAVVLGEDGRPLLSDLGLVRLLPGTLATAADDVRALATLCHQMLCGHAPFDGPPGTGRPPLRALAPHCPERLAAVVEAALATATSPVQEPDAATFAAALRAAEPFTPVEILPAGRNGYGLRAAPTRSWTGAPPGEGTGQPTTSGARPGRHRSSGAARLAWRRPDDDRTRGSRKGRQAKQARTGRRDRAASATRPRDRAAAATPRRDRAASATRPRDRAAAAKPTAAQSVGSAPTDRRRPSRQLLAAAGLVLLVVGAAAGGWASARGGEPVPALPAAAAPVADAAALRSVFVELDRLRAQAFAAADPDLLGSVWAPGSAGLAADTRVLTELAAHGRSAEGVRHDLQAVEVLGASPASARLRVVEALGSYAVKAPTGVLETVPARAPRARLVELTRASGQWRLATVTDL